MQIVHNNIADLREQRNSYRCEIEKFCKTVESLPAKERMTFNLYFRYGYSLKNIGDLCGVCQGTISRRIRRIAGKVETMLNGASGGRNGLPTSSNLR